MMKDDSELLLTTINEEEEDLKNGDTFGGGHGDDGNQHGNPQDFSSLSFLESNEEFDFIDDDQNSEEKLVAGILEGTLFHADNKKSLKDSSIGLLDSSSSTSPPPPPPPMPSSSLLSMPPSISTTTAPPSRLGSDFSPDSGRHSRGSLVLSENDLAIGNNSSSASSSTSNNTRKSSTSVSGISSSFPSFNESSSLLLSLPGPGGDNEDNFGGVGNYSRPTQNRMTSRGSLQSPYLVSPPSEKFLNDFQEMSVGGRNRTRNGSSPGGNSFDSSNMSFPTNSLAFNPGISSSLVNSNRFNPVENQTMVNIINLSNVINDSNNRQGGGGGGGPPIPPPISPDPLINNRNPMAAAAAVAAAAAATSDKYSCDSTQTLAANLTALARINEITQSASSSSAGTSAGTSNNYQQQFSRSYSSPPIGNYDYMDQFSPNTYDNHSRGGGNHLIPSHPPLSSSGIPRNHNGPYDDIWNIQRKNSMCRDMQIRAKFGLLGSNPGMFHSPHGFCLGRNGEIVVADTNNHRIQIFDDNGSLTFSFGKAGKEEGFLWFPRKVAVMNHNGNFVICDRGGERSRMQIFNPSGHFLHRIHIRFIDIVAGLAITREGHILAVDSVTPTLFVINEQGVLLKYIECSEFMSEPSDVGVFNDEYYICDFKGHGIVVVREDGKFLRRIGDKEVTRFPNGIDISTDGDVVVGDSHGNQFHVTIYGNNGKLLSEWICPHVKVSRCCGLKITKNGYVVTLAKNNHHVLVLNTLYV